MEASLRSETNSQIKIIVLVLVGEPFEKLKDGY